MGSIGRELSEYLVRWNRLEMMGEGIRAKIAENPYYQMQSVFQRLDKFKKGYLIPDDFSQFMLENNLYPTQTELYLVFRDFDSHRDGVVTLQALTQQLLPKQNTCLQTKAKGRKYYEPAMRLAIDLEYLIAAYFRHQISQIQQLTNLRLQIAQKTPFFLQEAFSLLDHQHKGVIQTQQIDRFLRNNGKVVSQDDLGRLYRLLCFDRESGILYQTVCEHLDPLGKGLYMGYCQRLTEKNMVQQDYIRQKIDVSNETVRNSRQRLILHNSIQQLQASNTRLLAILNQQQVEHHLHQQSFTQLQRRPFLY